MGKLEMTQTEQLLLSLIRIGIWKDHVIKSIPENTDWNELYTLAQNQGVAAIVLDGINYCYDKGIDLKMDFQAKMDWIGLVSQMEVIYAQHEKNMRALAAWYKQHNIKMMVLKGYGLSLNYPVPNHRPCGDIDIYLFGNQKEADQLLQEELGIKVDKSHHHHTVFSFQGETVENHYDFLNVYVRKSNVPIEKKLKEIANTDFTDCTDVVLPSVEFNAIYLLRHCAAHFASTEMTIRQVSDWAFFMKKHYQEIDFDKYLPYIKQEGMYRFYNLMGLFCMRELGFDASIFHGVFCDSLEERFAQEILTPEFKDSENGNLLWSLWVKPCRWWHNRWKNRLCYPDGALSEFTYGLWAKILKPSHFIQ